MPGRYKLNQVLNININSFGEKKNHVLFYKMKQGEHKISDDIPARNINLNLIIREYSNQTKFKIVTFSLIGIHQNKCSIILKRVKERKVEKRLWTCSRLNEIKET